MISSPPWFPSSTRDGVEPRSYRIWKWLLQKATTTSHTPDLLERIATVEWDLLIILDACRYDVACEVVSNIVIERATSPATVTQRFVEEVNKTDVFSNTHYFSANPATRNLEQKNLHHVPVYEEKWDESLSTIPPKDVYSDALKQVREGKRVVAHTLQPHYPHICSVGDEIRPVPGGIHPSSIGATQDETPAQNIPFAFFEGYTDRHRAVQSYRACSNFAWQAALQRCFNLSNEGYTVVITADHGELLGEWGLAGHPWGVRVRPLVEVPWVVIDEPSDKTQSVEGVNEKLEALGYL